jgi:3-hydroxyacyl-CoA dehydrogenase/enoyl-CoA hydratase/3-hydroxybutyryl-CoA epimerase
MIVQKDLGDGVVLLALNSAGPVNTLSAETNRDLAERFEALLADDAVKGVVLGSEKSDFAAGADITELRKVTTPAEGAALVKPMLAAMRRLETGGKPVVAALTGTALGGGLELALACHRRIAAENPKAVFGLPEITLGLMPGAGGTQRLPRLIGLAAAAPLILEGKRLSTADALKAGIVDEVVPADQLLDRAKAWILSGPEPTQPWDRKGYELPGFGPQSAQGRGFFLMAWARLRRRPGGSDPASEAILMALHHGLERKIDAGLAIETRWFAKLAASPEAKAKIRTGFFGINDARAMKMRPADAPPTKLDRIAVVGGGLMGRGIAHVAAAAGLQVVLLDVSQEQAEKGKAEIGKAAAREHERGRTATPAEAILARITATAAYADVAGVDAVVEAVFERTDVKKGVLEQVSAVVGPDTLVASNTSSLPITGLAGFVSNPERVIGMHFFSPVERMPLVEVVRGKETSDAALAKALDLLKRIRKTPIVVGDGLGFYTSRVVTTYSTEAFNLLAEGVSPPVIDAAATGAGFGIGVMSLTELSTFPLLKDIFTSMLGDGNRISDKGSRALETVTKLLDLGRKGKANGDGVYSYNPDGTRQVWPELKDHFPPSDAVDVTLARRRLLAVQSLEAARTLEDGVLSRPIDGDVGAVIGWGYPAVLGGPFAFIDRVGAKAFVAECDDLARQFGGRFEPPALLRRMAEKGERFYEV